MVKRMIVSLFLMVLTLSCVEATAKSPQELFGNELVKADGTKVPVSSLKGKTVAIYFSAHWCPPCRMFTPELVSFYNGVSKSEFEIVFVSFDRSQEAMKGYMTEVKMPWLAVPYGSEKIEALAREFGVRGIPALIVLDENGKVVTKNGRGDVSSKGKDALKAWR